MRFRSAVAVAGLAGILGGTGFPAPAHAATGTPPVQGIATLEAYRGDTSVVRSGLAQTLHPGMTLEHEDVIVTRRGAATARFIGDGSVLRIGPDSRVRVDDRAGKRDVHLLVGRLWARIASLQGRQTSFLSRGTIAAVRGTELSIASAEEESSIAVFEGTVLAQNDAGSLEVGSGQSAVAVAGKAPAPRLEARPRDAVRWALYYVPVLDMGAAGPGSASGAGSALAESSAAYRKGDVARALELLTGLSEPDASEPRIRLQRAALLLAIGSVDEAETEIASVLARNANDGDALSLRTIVAVVEDRKPEALRLAGLAVTAAPTSAAARIAESYALQASFDLAGATRSLVRATELAPGNALAWARLAELRASSGNLDAALRDARKAAELQPELARTQSVLGFAYLGQEKTGDARKAFERAIALDPGDPLPRLGLGLSRIRTGDLAEGRREIEVASALDPGNSIVRSYLGKAYFEEKNGKLGEREYERAKQLDPADPTPWFYHAIAKQTTNRPVEALSDLEKSVDLNDNRAVYRSRLLLDSDLASRSSAVGRIYGDLGFEHLALVEGWRSVNADAASDAAHRLLADSYVSRPRHEIARVSELLQSQLLQPLNLTPVQPQLAESSLFLLAAQGPAAPGFNEFNPLFERDRFALQVSGFGGEDDTTSGEAVVSGLYGPASMSAGYKRFKSDGYRVNNDQEDEMANVYAQVELGHKTSLQGELRYRDSSAGDLAIRFDPDDFSDSLREETETTTARAGLRHRFGPGTNLLLSYMHTEKELNSLELDPSDGVLSFEVDREESADSFEAQILHRAPEINLVDGVLRDFNLVAGGGHFRIQTDELTTLIFAPFPPDFPDPEVLEFPSEPELKHTNIYAYSHLGLSGNVTFTLGVSGDFFEDESGIGEQDQVNPKFGLTWNPVKGTTLRAAAFRALKRTLVTDQTLEPTQVAGFNQFYDDISATGSWVYGGAVDQKFCSALFGGVELGKRDLEVPRTILTDSGETLLQQEDSREYLGRAYLFATASSWLSLSAEYSYEEFAHEPEAAAALGLEFQEAKTHMVPLGAQLFHPAGLTASFRATYLDQEGEFRSLESPTGFAPGAVDFWVLDATLRYRLPRRFGFLALGVTNITDEDSTYQATDSKNTTLRPGRVFFGSLTLAIP